MTIFRTTKPSKTPKKLTNFARTSAAERLHHLKKRFELHSDQAKTYAEECRERIEANQEIIRKLRSEISEARNSLRSAKTNECLMRQALRNHHAGSSIFLEREPRDVNDSVDYKLSDLQNKLNGLRHARTMKRKHLHNLLNTFNEAVNDVTYLALEGPMGDTRCLAIENQICTNDKKYMEAEMIGHTYRHIRDQLILEGLSSWAALDAINKLVRCHEQELSECRRSEIAAVRGKEITDAEVFQTEFDFHSARRYQKIEFTDLKKKTEEEKYEFNTLWKKIQAHFAAQESMPLSHMTTHSKLSLSSSTEIHVVSGLFEYSEDEIELMKNVTASHTVPEVAEKYEQQKSKQHYAKAFVNELEVKKAALLQKLEKLSTVRDSLLHRADTEQDVLLRAACGDGRKTYQNRWSRLAVRSRVTQTLARLRQLLEYFTTEFVRIGLIKPPPEHDLADTESHLRVLLKSAGAGIAALMASLDSVEPERAQRAAAAAAFLMTRSERSVQQRRARLESDAARDDIGYVGTDGDTTGDDAVPSRTAIKRQAQLILMAKQKAKSRGRRN